jgi:hypothetical protein
MSKVVAKRAGQNASLKKSPVISKGNAIVNRLNSKRAKGVKWDAEEVAFHNSIVKSAAKAVSECE